MDIPLLFFFYLGIYSRGIIEIFPVLRQKLNRWLFHRHWLSEVFKLCITTTLFGVYQFIPGLLTLTLFQGHRCVRNINCKLFLRFLSTIASGTVCFVYWCILRSQLGRSIKQKKQTETSQNWQVLSEISC